MWRRIIATAGLFLLAIGVTALIGHLLPAPFADLTRALVVIGLGALLMAMAPAMPIENDAKMSFYASSADSAHLGDLAHSARSAHSGHPGHPAHSDRPVRHLEPLRAVPPPGLSPTQPEKLL
jgi:hypothetical protein